MADHQPLSSRLQRCYVEPYVREGESQRERHARAAAAVVWAGIRRCS